MSIYDNRLKIEIDNVIKRNLLKGYVPTANEVIGELSKYLSDNNLSVPSYKYSNKTSNFTAKDIDGAKQATLQDLDILYKALVELYELSEEQIEKFSIEKKKYDYRLTYLESQLTGLVNKYSTSGYTAAYRNNFSDMEGLDLVNTTADIDISNYEATLKRLQDVPYKDFTISVSSGNSILMQNGDISNYIEENGIVWQGIIEKNIQEETGIVIEIDTKSVNKINKLEIEMPVLKKCAVSIYTSVDGERWINDYNGDIVNRCATNFSTKIRYIRIVMKKTEADKFVLGKYTYYFIVDSIRLDSVNYTLQSDIVSTPISIGVNINKVSISTDVIALPSTSIQYYVATSSGNPNWIPISPLNGKNKQSPTVITFNTVEADQRLSIVIPDGVSNDAYELRALSVNGQRLFAIAEIDIKDITDNKLYKGINAWKVDSLDMDVTGPQGHSLFIENIRNIVNTFYKPILQDKQGLLINVEQFTQKTVRKYSTTIYREVGDTVIKEMVASSHPITIYLNGNILYSGVPSDGTVVTYPFKKGTNVLDVIVNISDIPTAASLDLNLAILTVGPTVCANKDPMRLVSLFNLRYNTNNQYDVYSLYKVGDQYMVIIKDPNLAIRYDLIYSYVIEPITEILFKAVLKREHSSVNITPRLTSYEIRFI